MTREKIAATILSWHEFRQKHPLISIILSLLMLAACAGGIYLVLKSPLLRITCFTGGCGAS